MSIKNVESLQSRRTTQGPQTDTTGQLHPGFGDFQKPAYDEKPVTNQDAYSGGQMLNLYGADIPSDTMHGTDAQYPYNYVHKTPGGHIVEYNDTPGSERIMIRHVSGTGVNIGPDGSVIVSSQRRVDVANENYVLAVAGDGTMSFEGNLTLNVSGDFNVNVGGEYNVTSSKKVERVNGEDTRTVYGDVTNVIKGNATQLVTGGGTNTYLQGFNNIVKGDSRYAVEGQLTFASSGVLTMTSEGEIVMTAPEANIAADNLSVFGDEGTIGGENMQMYTKNLRANETVYATTSINTHSIRATKMQATVVKADLDGNAKTATTAGTSLHQSYADGSGPQYSPSVGSNPGYTVATAELNEDDATETALPTASLLSDYREKGSKGVKKVKVDPDNVLLNNIDATSKTGGVSDAPLSSAEYVRAKMRDPAHRNNEEFIATAIASGHLSPEYIKSTPPNIASVKDTTNVIIQGQTPIGNPDPVLTSKRIRGV